jgi:DNA polymerase-3 subunit alpha
MEGFDRRVASGQITFCDGNGNGNGHGEAEYRERMEYELSVIHSMGYDDYYLIVWDYVNYAKSQGIPVGPGRGSGAGSLVAYAIGITEVDSVSYNLLFERFLNPERVSMPDFDVDFCYNRRDEVIDYVARRYGRERVSQIITFGTLAARAAIRDVGRAMGLPYHDVDVVARAVPHELGITIAEALRLPDLKTLYESSETVRKLVDTAMAIEGMPRNASIHAAGIVITDRPVASYVPLAVCNGTVVTQFDMDTVARLGVLKFDFLALRYLTIMHDAEVQIRETVPGFSQEALPLHDEAVYELIGKGTTTGVFQLESGGMRQMLTSMKPRNIQDIEAAIALYRPGPMEAIPTYLACRQNPEKITYPSPLLEPVLAETFGVTVYQEQVMSIFRVLAGYTYGHADIVRRAMSKKKAAVLEAERGSFVEGAVRNGMSQDKADQLFDDMSSFANYAFNKSHAAAYALISYRTAYLKAHYPGAYFAALLTSVLGNQTKMAEYTAEAARYGIKVLPPDINASEMNFHASSVGEGGTIRYGLLALKNVGEAFLHAILKERERGPYKTFDDFIQRQSASDLNKRQVEALIKSGAFDSFPTHRAQMLAVYETMIDTRVEQSRANLEGQMDIFSMDGMDDMGLTVSYPQVRPYTTREKLLQEREASGMFFSGQLLDEFGLCVQALKPIPIATLLPARESGDGDGDDDNHGDHEGDMDSGNDDGGERRVPPTDKARVRIAGIVVSVTVKTTKKDEKMAFFKVEDATGTIECLAFPKVYKQHVEIIRGDEALYVEGTLSVREDEDTKVLADTVGALVDNAHYVPPSVKRNPGAVQKAQGGAQDAPLSPAGDSGARQQRSSYGYNPYLDMPSAVHPQQAAGGACAPSPHREPPPAPETQTLVQDKAPDRLYLRVPDLTCERFRKAENLMHIFCDGRTAVFFYDTSAGTYTPCAGRMRLTPFVLERLEKLLGKENVVVK